jgi:hypothetical protein
MKVLTWDSQTGNDYNIQGSNNLEDWGAIGSSIIASASSTNVTQSDPAMAGNPDRFYRVASILPSVRVNVSNFGFELPVTLDGVINTSGGGPTGWTYSGTGGPGIFNPSATQGHYTGMGNADPNGGALPNMVGPSLGFMFSGNGNTGEFTQTVGAVLQPDTSYTLTVAIGQRTYFNAAQVPSDFRIALETATTGTVVAEFVGDVLNQNSFTLGENNTGTIILT